MLYPISTLPSRGASLKPALPTSARGSRQMQNHKPNPAASGGAPQSRDKKWRWEPSSLSGGGQPVGFGTSSKLANAAGLLNSARASSIVAATSSRRGVSNRRPGMIAWPRSENEAAQIGVLGEVADMLVHIGG